MLMTLCTGAGLPTPKGPLHGRRKVRFFSGRAYPSVETGKQIRAFTIELSAENVRNRRHYDDKANRLHTNDLIDPGGNMNLTGVTGKPVMVEHGNDPRYRENVVGIIDAATISNNNDIWVEGRIFGADEAGQEDLNGMRAIAALDNGELGSLSLRWQTFLDTDTNSVIGKEVVELSLCKKPHYESCVITTACGQPSSTTGNYLPQKKTTKVKVLENRLSFKMDANAEGTTTQQQQQQSLGESAASTMTTGLPATATEQSATPTQSLSNQGEAVLKDPAAMIGSLTKRVQEENSAKRRLQAELQAAKSQLAQIQARQQAEINAKKEEAIKDAPHLLQQLRKYGNVDQINADTAELLAKVLAEPVVNNKQQLGQLITACAARCERLEKKVAAHESQVVRNGDATRVAALQMAASAMEDVMDLVDDDSFTKHRRTRSTAGAADPLVDQSAQHYRGVLKGGDLPTSFYGDNWNIPQTERIPGRPSLAEKLAAREHASLFYDGQQQRPGFASVDMGRAQQPRLAPVSQVTTAASATPDAALSPQPQGASIFDDSSALARIAGMNSTKASALINLTSVGPGEALPEHKGDVFRN